MAYLGFKYFLSGAPCIGSCANCSCISSFQLLLYINSYSPQKRGVKLKPTIVSWEELTVNNGNLRCNYGTADSKVNHLWSNSIPFQTSHKDSGTQVNAVKFRKKALRLIFFKGPFWGAYFWRDICVSKSIGLALELKVNLPFLLCFTLYLREIFQVQALQGLIFGGAI